MIQVLLDGQTLNDWGFRTSFETITGPGLLTQGFVIGAGDIWAQDYQYAGLPTTIWTIELQ